MKALLLMNGMEPLFKDPYPLKAMLERRESLKFELKPISETEVQLIIKTNEAIKGTGYVRPLVMTWKLSESGLLVKKVDTL